MSDPTIDPAVREHHPDDPIPVLHLGWDVVLPLVVLGVGVGLVVFAVLLVLA